MITLRIIFYGLIAFVPGAYEDGTMAAISIDPSDIIDGHPHETRIWKCDKGCNNLTEILDPTSDNPTFKGRLISIAELQETSPSMTTRTRRFPRGKMSRFPSSPGQFSDFSWIPPMSEFVNRAGTFNSALLEDKPLWFNTILRLGGGEIEPCHAAHDKTSEEIVRVFRFRRQSSPGTTDAFQMIADAVSFEAKLQAESVNLQIQYFDGTGSKNIEIVPPEKPGEITLIVANFSSKTHQDDQRAQSCEQIKDHHFVSFYELSKEPVFAADRKMPQCVLNIDLNRNLMTCEKHLVLLDKKLKELGFKKTIPHSAQLCSPSQFADISGEFTVPSTSATVSERPATKPTPPN